MKEKDFKYSLNKEEDFLRFLPYKQMIKNLLNRIISHKKLYLNRIDDTLLYLLENTWVNEIDQKEMIYDIKEIKDFNDTEVSLQEILSATTNLYFNEIFIEACDGYLFLYEKKENVEAYNNLIMEFKIVQIYLKIEKYSQKQREDLERKEIMKTVVERLKK